MNAPPRFPHQCDRGASSPWRALVLAATLLALAGVRADPSGVPAPEQEAPLGGDFVLQGAGGPVSLAAFRGRAVLLFFGYGRCPDVCPVALGLMAHALEDLSPADVQRVQPLFVTLDPARDDPPSLQAFVEHFHPRFVGLGGSEDAVDRVAALYGVRHYRVETGNSALGYAVNHSAATYLISPDGSLRFIFPHRTPPSVLTEAIRYSLTLETGAGD